MFLDLRRHIAAFFRNEDGPTAVEYAIGLALIIVVIIGAVALLGNNMDGTFSDTATSANSPTAP